MGWSIKYVNNTSSPISVTITSTDEFTGYLGSVDIAAYDALYTSVDVVELDKVADQLTIDKYLNGTKVYFPGTTGYVGSRPGYTGSRGSLGYTGSAS